MGGDSEDVIALDVGGIKQEDDETTMAVKDEEGAAGPWVVKEEVGDAATVGVKEETTYRRDSFAHRAERLCKAKEKSQPTNTKFPADRISCLVPLYVSYFYCSMCRFARLYLDPIFTV